MAAAAVPVAVEAAGGALWLPNAMPLRGLPSNVSAYMHGLGVVQVQPGWATSRSAKLPGLTPVIANEPSAELDAAGSPWSGEPSPS